jgi:ribosomal protein L17
LLDKYDKTKELFHNERAAKRSAVLRLVQSNIIGYRQRLRMTTAKKQADDLQGLSHNMVTSAHSGPHHSSRGSFRGQSHAQPQQELFSLTQTIAYNGGNSSNADNSQTAAFQTQLHNLKIVLSSDSAALTSQQPDADMLANAAATVGLELDLSGLAIGDETLHYVLDVITGYNNSAVSALENNGKSARKTAVVNSKYDSSGAKSGQQLSVPEALEVAEEAINHPDNGHSTMTAATANFLGNLFYLNLKSNHLTDLACKVLHSFF